MKLRFSKKDAGPYHGWGTRLKLKLLQYLTRVQPHEEVGAVKTIPPHSLSCLRPLFLPFKVIEGQKLGKKLPAFLSYNQYMEEINSYWQKLVTVDMCSPYLFIPLKSLMNGSSMVNTNTFPKTIHELGDPHQTHLDSGLDELIVLALFPQYLKCEWMTIQVFSKLWAPSIARWTGAHVSLQLLLTLTLGQF